MKLDYDIVWILPIYRHNSWQNKMKPDTSERVQLVHTIWMLTTKIKDILMDSFKIESSDPVTSTIFDKRSFLSFYFILFQIIFYFISFILFYYISFILSYLYCFIYFISLHFILLAWPYRTTRNSLQHFRMHTS